MSAGLADEIGAPQSSTSCPAVALPVIGTVTAPTTLAGTLMVGVTGGVVAPPSLAAIVIVPGTTVPALPEAGVPLTTMVSSPSEVVSSTMPTLPIDTESPDTAPAGMVAVTGPGFVKSL